MQETFDPARVEAFHQLGWDYDDGVIRLCYALDSLAFEERFTLPAVEGALPHLAAGPAFERAVDVLAVAAGTSYFKAAAPAVVTGVPERLADFAADLYLHGLAEYAFANGLEPVRPRFETVSAGDRSVVSVVGNDDAPALVAVGGGKDSIVTIESVLAAGRPAVLGSVRTHRAIDETAARSGLQHLVMDRRIDPLLLSLNDIGARNGHVPVTAINSAALAALAVGLGFSAVVMSNESSASVPIAEYRGMPVNHQWSKGIECERALGELLPVPYFSLLRPLHEVEICRRFAQLPDYFDTVTSCNRAYTAVGRAAGTRWCGDCPKCRFVFLGLAAFLPPDTMQRMFDGADLLDDGSQRAFDAYRALLGIAGEPPMECIGTTRESSWAMVRLAADPQWRDHAVVSALGKEVHVLAGWNPLDERAPHRVPSAWMGVLDALS